MIRLYLLASSIAIAVLYGSTYQPFRFFNLADPGGAMDAIHYVDMARGLKPAEPETRHYRWVTPALARLVLPVARRITVDDELSLRLAFYLVNFTFSLVSCVVLFRILQLMRFSVMLSILGICVFASSRVTALVTATPMVDAVYFCAIAILLWFAIEKKPYALALALPVLILAKETIIPFALLPLLTELRKKSTLWVGLTAAAVTLLISKWAVDSYYSMHDASLAAALAEHAGELTPTLRRLFTASGIHDFQHGFSLFLPMSVIGALLNARYRYREVPLVVIATVPIAFVLALLSGNTGRMFFAAFPAVITYALITVEHVTARQRPALGW